MIRRIPWRSAVGVAALVVSLSHPASAQSVVTIKFSHVVTADTPKGRAAERFRQLAQELTNGRVRVEIYPNSTLYKDKEELDALQLGAVQMLAPSLGKFGQFGVREFEVFDLPYLFADRAALARVTQGDIGKMLFTILESKGITGLAYWDNGFKIFTANRPLTLPSDMKAMRVRIQPSRVIDAQMRALGAVPQVMAFSDTYRALQTGVVEGFENAPSNIYTQKMHEVQRYAVDTNHGYLGYAVIVNKKFWDGLPPDIRKALNTAVQQATEYGNEIAQNENDEALRKIAAAGTTRITRLTPAQRAQWQEAFAPVYRDAEQRLGRDFIQLVLKTTANPAR
jgi:C4-dicarboxylate-binding protein DctP